jgi:uncharacterized membrane protein YgcG
MKPWRIQRRTRSQDGPGISLFSFLAVLICTMGALVPLLLIITRTARTQAEAAAIKRLAAQGTELKTRREDAQWQSEQLKKSRARAEGVLADVRLELGHLEDHSRRLRDQLARYQTTIRDLEAAGSSGQTRLSQSQSDLERLQAQIGAARQQLAQAHQAVAGRRQSYAVVPYEGPNQTHRQPIYLECREDAVILQPEGIRLTQPDFEGPLGPGNPLAMALRAAREYLLARRDFDPKIGDPYPLLLVRPEGIGAYYAARAAMKSWGFDFGYELVDDNWKLAYPPPDPRLAETMRQVIATARADQARLIASAPREYGSRPKVTYHASAYGGFVAEGDSSDDSGPGYRPAGAAGAVAENRGAGAGGTGMGGGSGSGGGPAAGGGGQGGSSTGVNPYDSALRGLGGTGGAVGGGGSGGGGGGSGGGGGAGGVGGTGVGAGGVGGTGVGAGGGGGTGVGAGGGGGSGGGPALVGNGLGGGTGALSATGGGFPGGTMSPGGSPVAGSGGSGGTATAGNGYGTAGNPSGVASTNPSGGASTNPSGVASTNPSGGAATSPSGQSNAATAGGRAERPDGYVVGQPLREQPAPPPSRDGQTSADAPQGHPLRPGEWEPTPDPPPKKHDDKDDKDDDSPSSKHSKKQKKRDADWGVRDARPGSVAVTRSIRVECHGDRLVVVSERGPDFSKVIPLGQRTSSAVDPLISAVWEQMDSWGIAGRGMFWRPVLHVYVAPDADRRFTELSRLLDGSGVTLERK